MRRIILNDKEYYIPDIGFKEVVLLEKYGVNLLANDIQPLNMLTGFVALAISGETKSVDAFDRAADIIGEHLADGGDLEALSNAIGDAIKDSGFFQQMARKKYRESKN